LIESSLSEDDLETENNRAIDGLWHAEDYYWNIKRKASTKVSVSNLEVVDWGRKGPNQLITLNALRVLKGSGRIQLNALSADET